MYRSYKSRILYQVPRIASVYYVLYRIHMEYIVFTKCVVIYGHGLYPNAVQCYITKIEIKLKSCIHILLS